MAILRYPSEFTTSPSTDYIIIDRLRPFYGGGRDTKDNRGFVRDGDQVIMNVPQKVIESIGQNWRNSTLGPEGGDLFSGQISPGKDMPDLLKRITQRLVENFAMDKATNALGRLGASNLSANSILSGTSGIIYNPNMEVLYDGPQFRQFNFQFVLFSKSKQDAEQIHKIVRFFQKASVPSSSGAVVDAGLLAGVIGSSVPIEAGAAAANALTQAFQGNVTGTINSLTQGILQTAGTSLSQAAVGSLLFSGDNRFIKQPPFIRLTFKRGSNQHPYILPTKPCAINSLSIDYTPSGNYTIVNDYGETEVATVVATNISIGITEVKNVFESDYDNNGSKFNNFYLA